MLAKLDPQNELNNLRSAWAALSAAQAQLVQARNTFKRQETLLARGSTTRASFDQAQALRTAQSQVDDAKAQLEIAEDRVSYTQLKAGVAGTITARAAEAGEVVQPGQMIFQVARKGGWDVVFDVPAQVIRSAPPDAKVIVTLTDDPSVTAMGRVRQVDPQADPVTRTFGVRVSLIDPPAVMRLGATVTGRMEMGSAIGISIPASALTNKDRQAAVWIVDPASLTVSLRNVEVLRFDPGTVVVSAGTRWRGDCGDRRRSGPPHGSKDPSSRIVFVTGPNLSEWALKHRSFVIFMMIAVTVAGLTSYFRLGRSENPAFTFRTMIVQASWPGATLDDTLQQVTERLERKLQETKGLDFLRSYTSPGITTIFVNLKGATTASEVPDIWYQVRKNIGDIRHTLPAGVVGPGFNDDFGDTYGLIYGFTADGFTHRELRDLCRGHPLAPAAGSGRVEDRNPRRAGRADFRRVFDATARRTWN